MALPRLRPTLFALALAACQSHNRVATTESPVPLTQAADQPLVLSSATSYGTLGEATPPPFTLTASDGSGLQLVRVEARAVVEGPLAFTELHLYFHNPEQRIREGTFAITLPAGAAISRFAMEQNEQWQEAEVVETQLARRAYEDFLHRKQDPALLEKAAGNQFTARVFPIAAGGDKHIVISYSQELVGGRYTLPLRGLATTERIFGRVQVATGGGQLDGHVFDEHDWKPDRDITVAAAGGNAIVADRLVAARVKIELPSAAAVPTGVTLLVDTSASRALGFAHQAAAVRALAGALAAKYGGALPLQVVAFDQDTAPVYDGRADGFGDAAERALLARGALGASDLGQALAWAGAHGAHARVIVISDGMATAGAESEQLPAIAAKLAGAHVDRIDVALTGGIRDAQLAASIAHAALPHTGAVLDLDASVDEVATRVGLAVRTDVPVDVAGAAWTFPHTIAAAQAGDEITVYARLAKPAQQLDLAIAGAHQLLSPMAVEPTLLGRALAGAEITELEGRLAVAAPDAKAAIKAELVRRSIAARVVSSQTSMLVLETDADYARYGIDRRALADVLVVGDHGVQLSRRAAAVLAAPIAAGPKHDVKKADAPQIAQDIATGAPPATKRAGDDNAADRDGDGVPDVEDRDLGGDGADASKPKPEPATTAAAAPSPVMAPAAAPPPPPPSPMPERAEMPGPGAASAGASGDGVSHERTMNERDESPPRRMALASRDRRVADDDHLPNTSVPALTGPLADLTAQLQRRDAAGALKAAIAWHDKDPGDVLGLIGLGEALEASHDLAGAARAYGSIIDLFPARADFRRFAGERLERLGAASRGLAVDTYRRAVTEREDHLTGHRLLAYALLRAGDPAAAFDAIVDGLSRTYPDGRYAGGTRVLSEDAGMIGAALIAKQPDRRAAVVATLARLGARLPVGPSTRFILYWETDDNDVDFHIQDARGGHAYYQHKELASGGSLYADITTGYGPECFTIEGQPKAGPYHLSINYFSQGPMGYGMGLLQIVRYDGRGGLTFEDRPYVIMVDHAFVDLGTFKS